MSKTFQKASLTLTHTDAEKNKVMRVKALQNLKEDADDAAIQTVAQALKPLLKQDVDGAVITTEYHVTLA